MKILVGSKNPVKINATENAFKNYFKSVEVLGISAESRVSDQPINEETYIGSENRALSLVEYNSKKNLNADFFVGIEGGIQKIYSRWFAFGCMCIIDKDGKKSFGTSAHFEIPEEVTKQLLAGRELGVVMDEIIKMKNTKQKFGAIGFFTNGVMDRKELYIPGLISALVPFQHKEMFFKEAIKNENSMR